MYVQVQCSLYEKYFGYAANAYYLMILVLHMFFFEAKWDYLLPITNLVKTEPQAGDKFSCEISFMGILFSYPRIKTNCLLKIHSDLS